MLLIAPDIMEGNEEMVARQSCTATNQRAAAESPLDCLPITLHALGGDSECNKLQGVLILAAFSLLGGLVQTGAILPPVWTELAHCMVTGGLQKNTPRVPSLGTGEAFSGLSSSRRTRVPGGWYPLPLKMITMATGRAAGPPSLTRGCQCPEWKGVCTNSQLPWGWRSKQRLPSLRPGPAPDGLILHHYEHRRDLNLQNK